MAFIKLKIAKKSTIVLTNAEYSLYNGYSKNTKKTGDTNKLHVCCHCTSRSFTSDSTISVDGINFIRGYENTKNIDMCENIAYLAHFRCKTFDEWNSKCDRNGNGI